MRPLMVALIAAVFFASLLAETLFATPSVAAAFYKSTAQCFTLAQSAGVTSRRAVLGARVCGGLDDLSQLIGSRFPGADQPKALPTPARAYPLKVSANSRYLVDQNGTPFLMVGDSPQAMVGNLSADNAEFFLADRQKYGFNTIWVTFSATTTPAAIRMARHRTE